MRLFVIYFISTYLALATCSADIISTLPSRWARIDLDMPMGQGNDTDDLSETVALEKRRQVTTCEFIGAAAAAVILGNNLEGYLATIVNHIIALSRNQDCGTFTGAYRGMCWRYRANGKNCDTTAERKTLYGSLLNHYKTQGNTFAENECLDLTHGGTWDGFLQVGTCKNFDKSVYCGPGLNYQSCTSGGKKDVPGG